MEKRKAGGVGFSRSSSLSSRDRNHENGSIQCCNRIGCSTRFYAMKDTEIGDREKAKCQKASFRSMSSKTLSGKTSLSLSASSERRKPGLERRNQMSVQEVTNVESSKKNGVRKESEPKIIQKERLEDSEPSSHLRFQPQLVTETLESFRTESSSRKKTSRPSESASLDTSSSSSIGHSLASVNTRKSIRNASQVAGSVSHKYGLRSDSVSSKADPLPVDYSPSHSGSKQRVEMVRKRPSSGETSSIKGKMVESSKRGYSGSRRVLSTPSLPRPECLVSPQTSRRSRKQSISTGSADSIGLPLAPPRERRRSEQDESSFTSEHSMMQFTNCETVPENSSRSFTIELSSNHHNTSGQLRSSSQITHVIPISHAGGSDAGVLQGSLGDGDGYRHFDSEGIAEVLLALERIEHNEDLTYQQLLVLESNLSFVDLAFYDQHRAMRLDIDDMSYEDLLALEEKMGSVSTALTEEALSKCLDRSVYTSPSISPDTKCSICQEEYAVGDEIGKLACEHGYHVDCIYQWLRQKNWCPICKSSASSS